MLKYSSIFFVLFSIQFVSAQCINTFPNTENFDAGNGNWVSGGTGNDWEWGTPTKPVINAAFSGANCWVGGTLNTSFYSFGERSYIESPCYDFSALLYPYVSFAIFWELEKTYDGTNFQSSIDGGATWQNVGAFNEPPNCMNANWYNTSSITNLTGLATVKSGWSGNIQNTSGSCQGGNGSNGWVIAKHCLGNLAGEQNVRFRFTLGAGTQCNSYDGIAIDDFTIENAPANSASFTASCSGPGTFTFAATANPCPDNLQWSFGDGTNATGITALHTYTNSGTYTVTFSAGGPCNPSAIVSQQVEVLAVNLSAQDASCGTASDGFAFVTNPQAGATYQWSTSPTQTTDTAFNLTSGTYTITVSKANACSVTASVAVGQASGLNLSSTIVPDTCNKNLGSILVTAAGGTAPYSYNWSVAGSSNSISNLGSGNYQLTVDDVNACSASAVLAVGNEPGMSLTATGISDTCLRSVGTAIAIPTNGSLPINYNWSNGASSVSVSSLAQGNYSVTAQDNIGCSASATVSIGNTSGLSIQLSAKENVSCYGFNDGSLSIRVTGGNSPYQFAWSNNGTDSIIKNLGTGLYSVTVDDANGCEDYFSATIDKDFCESYIYFPTAFSPNGDGKNDTFKPKYSQDLKKYAIQIYNRWGELVYASSNVNEGWDGIYKDVPQPISTYIWTAQFEFSGSAAKTQSGNMTLVR